MSTLPLLLSPSAAGSLAPVPRTSDVPMWGLELLRQMDWKRFQELTSLFLCRAGFETETAWVRPDGAVGMHVRSQNKRIQAQSLVLCAGWNGLIVEASTVLEFLKAVCYHQAARGIIVTPGEFSPDARLYARNKKLELLDGASFLSTVSRMSREEQAYYHRMATVGAWNVPTCPACSRKMELREKFMPLRADDPDFRDLVYKESRHVSDVVRCRKLHVKSNADVLFLKSVTAESMVIEGRVMGNFICMGKLEVLAGATVSGLVAARHIRLEPGGVLEAEARILNATEVQPISIEPQRKIWGCPSFPKCKLTLPSR